MEYLSPLTFSPHLSSLASSELSEVPAVAQEAQSPGLGSPRRKVEVIHLASQSQHSSPLRLASRDSSRPQRNDGPPWVAMSIGPRRWYQQRWVRTLVRLSYIGTPGFPGPMVPVTGYLCRYRRLELSFYGQSRSGSGVRTPVQNITSQGPLEDGTSHTPHHPERHVTPGMGNWIYDSWYGI